MIVFDKVIQLICSKQTEIEVNVHSNKVSEFIPKIYYTGEGKTGSSSIKRGFPSVNVAHWHDTSYFEAQFNTTLLSSHNYDLYDLIIYIGTKFKFKPVIIECTRNPINIGISTIFQHIKRNRNHKTYCEICEIKKHKSNQNLKEIIRIIKKHCVKQIDNIPYSCEMFTKHFDIDLPSCFDKQTNYYFKETNQAYLLFLKFEDIQNWKETIHKHLPYKFVLKHENKTVDKYYQLVKQNITFTKEEIQPYLDSFKMTTFYSEEEIKELETRFIKK